HDDVGLLLHLVLVAVRGARSRLVAEVAHAELLRPERAARHPRLHAGRAAGGRVGHVHQVLDRVVVHRPENRALIAETWRWSVPQQPPTTLRCGRRVASRSYPNARSSGSPASSTSAASSSAWLLREAFAR